MPSPSLPGIDKVGHKIIYRSLADCLNRNPGRIIFPQLRDDSGSDVIITGPPVTPTAFYCPANYAVDQGVSNRIDSAQFSDTTTVTRDQIFGLGSDLPFLKIVNLSWNNIQNYVKAKNFEFAIVKSTNPLYKVFIENEFSISLDETAKGFGLTAPFGDSTKDLYSSFLERWGTHYIYEAEVGGELTYVFMFDKTTTTQSNQNIIKLGLDAFQALLKGFNISHQQKITLEQTISLSNNVITCIGGQASLPVKIDPKNILNGVAAWIDSILLNPEVISYKSKGIWNLVNDSQLKSSIEEAYKYLYQIPDFRVKVQTQNGQWFNTDNDGWAGTKGQSMPLAGFELEVSQPYTVAEIDFQYFGVVSGYQNGAVLGPCPQYTNGQSTRYCGNPNPNLGTRLRGFRVKLTGQLAGKYNVHYQGHISNIGDTSIYSNGEWCGSRDPFYNNHIEAIRVWLEAKS